MTNTHPSLNRLALAKAVAAGSCEFCEKSGLAILPIRAALMRPDAGAPPLPAALHPVDGKNGKPLALAGPAAAYTGRTLRSGYLYVYDERGMWEKYWITDHGYLMKTLAGVPMNAAYAVGREPCDKTGHKEIAACLTVPEPHKARRIWVAFSDVEWTPRVLQLHQDEAYRNRHMRVFDVRAWLARHTAAHARSLATVAEVVAEYAPKTKGQTFAFSPYPFRSRASTQASLLHAAGTLGPQPAAMLIVDDPVAITTEIAARLAEANEAFMAGDERSRKLSVSSAIVSLQGAAAERAELNELAAYDILDGDSHWVTDGVGRLRYVADPPAATPESTAADLENVAAKSWTKYAASYDEKARSRWQDEFNTDYRRFSDEALHPLARSHVAWMTSGPMRNHLECTYDGASAEAGLVYTRVLTMCVQGTEQFEPCAELYVQWLNGAYADGNNLVLRAFALNLDSLRTKLIDSVPPETAWDEIQWDGLIGAFNNAVDKVAKQAPEVLGQFLAALGGSITQALQRAADGPVRHGLVACGMVSGRPVVPVTLAGSYKAYRASLIRQVLKASGARKMSEHAMQREVSLALRRLQIRGEPMSQSVSSTFLVMIDEEAIKGMPPGLKKSEQARWLAGAIRSADEIERLNLAAWRERIDVPDMTARAGKSLPFVGNLLAGLFQWAAYQKVSRDLASAMPDEKREHQFRLGSAVLAMGATVADTIARAAGAMAQTTLNHGRAARLEVVERTMNTAARRAGVIAAGINAFWDAKNASEAFQQKRYALFAALGISAVAGIAAAILIAFGAVIPVIVATLIAIGAGVMATFLRDDKSYLQDDKLAQWLKRCYWGILDAKDRYPNSAVEMSELGVATGG